ncbi:MAG: GntR family transcriptional regulator [Planctomycetes bacterium]|nr:GntR family transcriptional regulator [Planctomycetota bacterium]
MSKTIEFQGVAPRASLGDMVHQQIVEALVSGQFSGGEELNEVSLASQFHVSRTPVREALRRLASEGLVINQRNRQTTVVEMSRRDVIETYEVRRILEASAARLAVEQVEPRQLADLRTLAAAAIPPASSDWGQGERRFDEELHRVIADSCGNRKLQQEIQRYKNLVRFVRSRVARSTQRLAQGHAEHLRILDALERRNGAQAEAEMSAHIASALQCVLEDLPLLGRTP